MLCVHERYMRVYEVEPTGWTVGSGRVGMEA